MKNTISWLSRKKAALCILAGICAISLFVIINSQNKIYQNQGGSYVIKIKHYGIDAAEMERSVTIPMEDALFSIPGVYSVQSSSENSLSSVYVQFKTESKGKYEAVRDAVQNVYETLSPSAQRPEILSSNNSRVPVWSAAVIAEDLDNAAFLLEKIVKPRLESLEGTGEVLVSGTGLKEIFITIDQEKLAFLNLEPSYIASTLGMNDSIFSGGTIVQGNREIIITVDGRYLSLKDALIPLGEGKFIKLIDIANISEQQRVPDIFSRLNGKKTASIAVMNRHGADLRKLSKDIKKEITTLSLPLEFTVLSDIGLEESAAFKSVFNAALLGSIMVALISLLLSGKNGVGLSGFFCALAIPLICFISIAVLFICGFPANRLLLAGIAAGICTAIDAVILCSEKLRKCSGYASAAASLISLTGPLIAGGATTVAALLPLFSIEDINVRIISISIAVVSITSLILSLTLLPPLLLWNINYKNKNGLKLPLIIQKIGNKIFNSICRLLARTVKYCNNHSVFILLIFFCITLTAILMLFAKGVDTSSYNSEDSIYAQIEFDGGLLAEETDRLLALYSEELIKLSGIKNVETGARIGSGSLLISFDPKQIQAQNVREAAKNIYIPGGFVFFHESSVNERYWEINIYGDETKKYRELAEELAYICSKNSLIKESILNFKEGSKKLILLPDREVFANISNGDESNLSFSDAASGVRLGVYGPVAYKRIDSSGEIDVRIKTGNSYLRKSKEEAINILVSAGNKKNATYLPISSLMQFKEETEPSSIKRDNRRRTASITITTKPMDPRRVKQELSQLFKNLDLPPGYSIEFDPEAIKQSEKLLSSVFSLILAIIFCYMIIASINESFSVPLLILSTIPSSLAIPAIILVLSGSAYNSAVACAFIAVSGMTVNSAILCVDSIKSRLKTNRIITSSSIYLALRQKLPALLATSGTTIAGAIPFLFLTEGANTLIRTLSLVSAIGVACSCICSLTIIPSLLTFSQKIFRLSGTKKLNRSKI